MVHVPFRGGASPLTEVLGGRVDLLLEAMTLSIGQIHSGKLRALAVTSRERWKALPDVPRVAETGRGYEVTSFIGLGATGARRSRSSSARTPRCARRSPIPR